MPRHRKWAVRTAGPRRALVKIGLSCHSPNFVASTPSLNTKDFRVNVEDLPIEVADSEHDRDDGGLVRKDLAIDRAAAECRRLRRRSRGLLL